MPERARPRGLGGWGYRQMQIGGGIDESVWVEHAWRNRAHSMILLILMGGYLAALGWVVWGVAGVLMLLAVGASAAVFNPSISPQLVMRLYGARPLTPQQAPGLWAALEEMASRAGLPRVPVPYYLPSRMLNAFATGSPERAAIAVTDGLLRQLSWREIVGVMAHEIGHIRSRDLWVMGLADLLSRATTLLSLLGQFLLLLSLPLLLFSAVTINWWAILLLIFAPTLSALTQMALSRTREYDADLNAARLSGDPEGLARALLRIERVQGGWMERILMPGRRVPEPSLLRTHPPTGERIRRLLALKGDPRYAARWLRALGGPPMEHTDRAPVTGLPRWRITGLWY